MSEIVEMVNVAQALLDKHIADAKGNATAFRYGGKGYTFNDLAAVANRTGNMLKQAGLTPGAAILLLAPPSPAYAGTILGAMKIGAWAAVVEGAIDATRLRSAARAISPALLIVHHNYVSEAAGLALESSVIIIGAADPQYRSFVDLIREQPSSLSAAAVTAKSTALAVSEETHLRTLSHGDLARELASASAAQSKTLDFLRALEQSRAIELA